MDWLQIGKGYVKAVYCHPAYLTYMQSTCEMPGRLDEAQAGIKIAGRNTHNLRYAGDTTHMAQGKYYSLLMSMKEESKKAGLKLNIQKIKIMASGPISSWETDGETMETVIDFILEASKVTTQEKTLYMDITKWSTPKSD